MSSFVVFLPPVGTGPARLLQASVSAGFDAANDPELFAVLRTVDVEGEATRVARATATDAHRRARTVAAEREVHMVRSRHRAACNSTSMGVVEILFAGSHFRYGKGIVSHEGAWQRRGWDAMCCEWSWSLHVRSPCKQPIHGRVGILVICM